MRLTHSLVPVLQVLAEDFDAQYWAYALSKRTGVPPGVLHPMLNRLAQAGWLTASWEEPAQDRNVPRRRLYELTDSGRIGITEMLARARVDYRFSSLFS
jgi:PadR family transcriptional regulator PadR